MKTISIRITKTQTIGPSEPIFIVAEMGQNHNGSLRLAKRILLAAKKAGVDAVKLQTLTSEKLVSKKTPTYGELDSKLPKLQWLMYKQAELSRFDHIKLFSYAKEIGMLLFSTPFDEDNVDFLDSLGVPLFKIASGDMTHYGLLRHVARKKKPIIISTGMATLAEIKEAVNVVEKIGNKQIILLHCTSSYPCKPEHVNLRSVTTLMETFPYPVGLSDHTLDEVAAVALAGMGGKILEKHFTCDKTIPGIDHWLSMDEADIHNLIVKVRTTEEMMGSALKKPNAAEQVTLRLARRSVISTRNIAAGTTITPEMISIRRPGTGIAPKDIDVVIGKMTRVFIESETPIIWKMLK